MHIGVLSDAHGNLEGLRSCLNFLRKRNVEHYIFLGDATGYFPQSAEVCALLAELPLTVIAGNHEAMLAGILPMADAMRQVIRPPDVMHKPVQNWLRRSMRAGPTRLLELGGRTIRLTHGSPENPWQGRVSEPDTLRMDCDILLTGHSHRPLLARIPGGGIYLNPGSCGYPRDNGAWLSLAILDTATLDAQIFRLPNSIDPTLMRKLHPAVKDALRRSFPPAGIIMETS